MNCTECTTRLDRYVDRELSDGEQHALEMHIQSCVSCRAQLESLKKLLATAASLPKEIPPPRDLWAELSSQIEVEIPSPVAAPAGENIVAFPPAARKPAFRPAPPSPFLRWLAPLGVAAAIVFFAAFTERMLRSGGTAWSVANLAGAPRVDRKIVEGETAFRLGQWLDTDDASRAKVTVGNIGEVSVDSNSRLRLVGMTEKNHRLELARGSMSALIWAPPRLFFVNTPSATAVDLGCAYTLNVDDKGDGELEVTIGLVALQHGDRESIIRMGMKCVTRRGAGPGTPFAIDAPAELRDALTRFDFERGASKTALNDILYYARTEDAITLWHLLARTQGDSRVRVYDQLAKLSPPPSGVTRAGILSGDKTMRHAWGNELGLGMYATQ